LDNKPPTIFPRPKRHYARTPDEIPLALLHLATTLLGRDAPRPQAILDNAFFHCEYDGEVSFAREERFGCVEVMCWPTGKAEMRLPYKTCLRGNS